MRQVLRPVSRTPLILAIVFGVLTSATPARVTAQTAGAPDGDTHRAVREPVHYSAVVAGFVSNRLTTLPAGWLEQQTGRGAFRLDHRVESLGFSLAGAQEPGERQRSWVGRHPVIFGALVGFAGGFLIGYLPGDDAVFDDFTAEFNGWVLGGVGAGAGAVAGAIVGSTRK